jgi:hypothetical protein
MADINVEMLKEKLYPAAKALFIIGETLVDVSKQHISAENAIDKIRSYMHNTDVIGSRYRVDKLIKECMEPQVYNHFEDKQESWIKECFEKQPNISRYKYFVLDEKDLKDNIDNTDRIAQAIERTKKYMGKD